MIYFRDANTGFIVRKPDEGMHLEYTYDDFSNWIQTEPDSSYEREYWLGEGNSCLFDITEEEAIAIISSRSNKLNKSQIQIARKCYLFGEETIYIEIDENSPIFVYQHKDKKWSKLEADSFWDSWDSAPHLFLPISNEGAIKRIYCDDETSNLTDTKAEGSKTKLKTSSENIVEQMVNGIVGKESENPSKRETEIRKNLSGRALEYLMFMDDD
ncbi:MAG: hypothetical protein IJP16_07175 [Clostridia bacterium]|nr:hypothetical protein [Clostridia bacterium]